MSVNRIMENTPLLRELDNLRNKTLYTKVELLTWDEKPFRSLEGRTAPGSAINIENGNSNRRTCSFTFYPDSYENDLSDANAMFAINKKIRVYSGISTEDLKYKYKNADDIVWFLEGTFIISSADVSVNMADMAISVSAVDKMACLDGSLGGTFPAETILGTYKQIDSDGNSTYVIQSLYDIIRTMVMTYGFESEDKIFIEDVSKDYKQVCYWGGTEDLTIYTSDDGKNVFYSTPSHPVTSDYVINGGNYTSEVYSQFDEIGYRYIQLGYYIPSDGNIFLDKDLSSDGNLIASAGDNVASILNSIVDKLGGNYEFFYDEYGNFIFREIKNNVYISRNTEANSSKVGKNIRRYDKIQITQDSPVILDKDNAVGISGDLSRASYDLSDKSEFISSYSNNYDYANNFYNDFHIWYTPYNSSDGSDKDVQYHYHTAIMTVPEEKEFNEYNVVYLTQSSEGTTEQDNAESLMEVDLAYWKEYLETDASGTFDIVRQWLKLENTLDTSTTTKASSASVGSGLSFVNRVLPLLKKYLYDIDTTDPEGVSKYDYIVDVLGADGSKYSPESYLPFVDTYRKKEVKIETDEDGNETEVETGNYLNTEDYYSIIYEDKEIYSAIIFALSKVQKLGIDNTDNTQYINDYKYLKAGAEGLLKLRETYVHYNNQSDILDGIGEVYSGAIRAASSNEITAYKNLLKKILFQLYQSKSSLYRDRDNPENKPETGYIQSYLFTIDGTGCSITFEDQKSDYQDSIAYFDHDLFYTVLDSLDELDMSKITYKAHYIFPQPSLFPKENLYPGATYILTDENDILGPAVKELMANSKTAAYLNSVKTVHLYKPTDWRAELYLRGSSKTLVSEAAGTRPDMYEQELLDNFDLIYNMKEKKFKEIVMKPFALPYFFDVIEPSEKTFNFCVDEIGPRIYATSSSDKTLIKMYDIEVPDNCLICSEKSNKCYIGASYEGPTSVAKTGTTDEESGETTYTYSVDTSSIKIATEEQLKEIQRYLYTIKNEFAGDRFVNIDEDIFDNIIVGAAGISAEERMRTLLKDYTQYGNQITLDMMPIHTLDVNQRITLNDKVSGIVGDYVIDNISFPLDATGTMSVSATKVKELEL